MTSLPYDLVLVRHAESEGNVAQTRSREARDHSIYTPAFRARHTATYRLTDRGVAQAKAAGDWLRHAGLGFFEQAYVSEYIRAIETAAYLDLPDARWTTTAALRERDVGLMGPLPEDERQARFPEHVRHAEASPYFWSPPEGESLAQVAIRLRAGFLSLLERPLVPRRVIGVSHGHTIRVLRALLEGVPFWLYDEREKQTHPSHVVLNAHIFHYTRVNPENPQEVLTDFGWVRSICPWDISRIDSRWRPIERRTQSSQDLLAIVERFPRLLTD